MLSTPKSLPLFSGAKYGNAGQYETIAGRAWGELDPNDPLNAVIQDIALAPRNANGNVDYMATFFIVKPIDMSKASGLLWHDVPNRGGRASIVTAERSFGDVGLSIGWQGDNSGTTAQVFPNSNDYAIVPVAVSPDGSPITGAVLGRIVNQSGPDSQPILVQGNPIPYLPFTLDNTQALLTTHAHETIDGQIIGEQTIASTDWAWAHCDATHLFPGVPTPGEICLRNGFDPTLLYQAVYTAQNPFILGIGFAAFRDVGTFFKNEQHDDYGTANPLASAINWSIARGVSQSGNYVRQFIHLGFNQDEAGRQVYDGAWPIIAGRRLALNFRWAQPDSVLELYQLGSEGPQWWADYQDVTRGLPSLGILDRCQSSGTCPKIVEHMGSTEFWALKLASGWVGTDAAADLPLPDNVRRYYIPSTTHGGGNGGFNSSLPGVTLPTVGAACPGNNYGTGILPANPVSETEVVNALRAAFRNWVMNGTPPPPSRYPTLSDGTLVPPTKDAMGFPGIPGLPSTAPMGLLSPLLDYDWGATFDPIDLAGVPANLPPAIKQVIVLPVPRVDSDGNELGGVPVVLRDAPLGTYLGWNITAAGFHEGEICNYVGGMIPFARTAAERLASGDPRLSLEERYTNHAGYVQAVTNAAANAVAQGFLLQADANSLISSPSASKVLQ